MRVRRPTSRHLLLGLAASLAAASAHAAEDEGVVGAGTPVAQGSKVSTAIGNLVRGTEDVDDYVFDGYAGQALSITVAGKGALIPFVYLYRPDGSLVTPEDGAKIQPMPLPSSKPGKKPKVAFKLDQTGVWTLRIRGGYVSREFADDPLTVPNEGDDPSTEQVESKHVGFDYTKPRTIGEYTLTVKIGAAPATTGKNLLPDANGEYRFVVPGIGGGTFNSSLKWKGGGAPTFFSFRTPDGGDVPGFAGSLATTSTASTAKNYLFPSALPLGSYVLTYRAVPGSPAGKPKFSASLKAPKVSRTAKGKLQTEEPILTGVTPLEGGPGSLMNLTVTRLADENNVSGTPRVLIGRFPLEQVQVPNATTITGRAPANLPEGTFDVVVESTTGQAAVRAKTFKRVPPPDAHALEPTVGTSAGGFEVTVTGTNFNPAQNGMRIGFINKADNSEFQPPVFIDADQQTTNRVVFAMPSGALAVTPGTYEIKVIDNRTGLSDVVPMTLVLTDTAAISRVFPGLTPVLGGETMFVQGARFDATAEVQLEVSAGSNSFSPVTTTFIDDRRLSFTAPARPTGVYRVRVLSLGFLTPTRTFAYYSFADLTPALGLGGGSDNWDASSTAVADFDRDGDDDLVLSRALTGVDTKQTTSQTRVLVNDGSGALTDVTSGTTGVMPVPSTDDDWRADRVWVTDVDGDTYPDLVITTNSKVVPAAAKSHTRFLLSEPRGTVQSDRVFRDRTLDVMAPPRVQSVLYGNGTSTPDNWRGLDLWIGDLDLASGPPEMIVTHDEVKEDVNVGCTPYCTSPYGTGVTYAFYWGGSRMFVWDKNARGGLGRYKFSYNFFPRKSGVVVPIMNPPPGVSIPSCTSGSCRGTFTPFAGQKLAVGFLDADGKPDIAVVSNTETLPGNVSLETPLQVAINRFTPGGGGSDVTDVTDKIGGVTGSAVAIGQTGFPDGNAYGTVAVAQATAPSSGSALRFYKFKPSVVTEEVGDFEEITSKSLPDPASGVDKLQASAMRFIDIDQDGDQDLILVANAAPGGTEPAFRVLRNEVAPVNGVPSLGVFRETLKPLLVALRDAAGDPFDGSVLSIGDLDGDDALDFVISRSAAGTGLQTRAVRTDK